MIEKEAQGWVRWISGQRHLPCKLGHLRMVPATCAKTERENGPNFSHVPWHVHAHTHIRAREYAHAHHNNSKIWKKV